MLSITDIPKPELYPKRLKGISVALNMFKFALMGNYCNFGVFLLYGDRTLEDAFQVLVKLMTSVSHSDLMVYGRLLDLSTECVYTFERGFFSGVPKAGTILFLSFGCHLDEPYRILS